MASGAEFTRNDAVVSPRPRRQSSREGRGVHGTRKNNQTIIVLTASDRPFLDRIATYLPGAFPCAVDVFPYTRAEIVRMSRERNTLISDALATGRTVFRRAA